MSPIKVGQVWRSRYLVEKVLGRGGMGIVYGAIDQQQPRRCAIKVLLNHRLERLHYRQRLLAEIDMMQRLEHPHIVQVYDVFKGVDQTEASYLVMEYLEGETLGELMNRGEKITIKECLTLMQQALSALAYAHDQGVIHRDLKPENLFLSFAEDGQRQLKILDFGVAKDLTSNISLTASLDFPMIGTPHYMAPEQIRNQKATPSCDLYAMGIIIYQMIAGYPPFAMSHLNIPTELKILPASLRLTWLHINTPPPALEFEAGLDSIIIRTLAKDPIDRPQSSVELSTLLSKWLSANAQREHQRVPLPPPKASLEVRKIETASMLTLEALNEAPHQRPSSIDPRLLDLKPTVDLQHFVLLEKEVDKTSIPREKSPIVYDYIPLSTGFRRWTSSALHNHFTVNSPKIVKGLWKYILVTLVTLSIVWWIHYIWGERAYKDDFQADKNQPSQTVHLRQLMEELSSQNTFLNQSLPSHISESELLNAISILDLESESADLKIDQQLFRAYSYTWLSSEEYAQKALISLFEINKRQISMARQWHIYALTLLRVRLKTSMQSRLKLALKTFQLADQILISSKEFDDLDRLYLLTRLNVYKQHEKWGAMVQVLQGLRDQGKHSLSSDMKRLLELAKKRE